MKWYIPKIQKQIIVPWSPLEACDRQLSACSRSHALVHSHSPCLQERKRNQSMLLSRKEIASMILFLMGRCRTGVVVEPLFIYIPFDDIPQH